jgi:hypothetical protein
MNHNAPLPDDDIDRLLTELGAAEPPAQFRRDVMNAIAPATRRAHTVGAVRGTAGGPMKKVLIGLSLAAALILGVMSFTGFPPALDTQGTIGAAKRYNANQLSDSDVKLGDTSAQAFIQSDTFQALIKDPKAVKLLLDGRFTEALKGERFREFLNGPQFTQGLQDPKFREGLGSAGLDQALGDTHIAEALADADIAAALADDNFREFLAGLDDAGLKGKQFDIELAGLQHTLTKADLMGMFIDAGFSRQTLADLNFDAAFSDEAALKGIADLQARGALAGLAGALSDDAFLHGIDSAGFRQMLTSSQLQGALGKVGAFDVNFLDSNFFDVMLSDAFQDALELQGFDAALSSGLLTEQLQGALRY